MNDQSIYFVGTREEIAHHAAPLMNGGLSQHYSISVVSPSDVLGLAKPGDLAVFYSEHFDRFRHACTALKQRNIGTLYMIDGILEWRNAWENRPTEPACPFAMRPVLAHKVACIGASQARVLKSWGNGAKIEVVGIPRLDAIQPDARPEKCEGPFRILVMSAKCPGFTDQQIATTTESLWNLKDWFASHQELAGRPIVPVWRLTDDLDSVIGVENRLNDLSGSELIEMLRDVDAVITTPSTAMLEAMRMQKPVALLDYHQAPKYVAAAWEIKHPGHISGVVEQLMNPPPERLQFQDQVLHDSLLCDRNSVDRMSNLMQRMLESAHVQMRSGTPELKFDAGLLEPVEQGATWNQAAMFPRYSEFSNSDPVQLQAELAHSRREIEFLNRELSQARSELGEAHKIFDQIQGHPIAGPIVRARQKMLRWFGAGGDPASGADSKVADQAPEDSRRNQTPKQRDECAEKT